MRAGRWQPGSRPIPPGLANRSNLLCRGTRRRRREAQPCAYLRGLAGCERRARWDSDWTRSLRGWTRSLPGGLEFPWVQCARPLVESWPTGRRRARNSRLVQRRWHPDAPQESSRVSRRHRWRPVGRLDQIASLVVRPVPVRPRESAIDWQVLLSPMSLVTEPLTYRGIGA
jgi:hypothetical protein